ncbi:MAG: hypothetical protein J3K34DRAFT_417461 [Monoraphidium minutum]|nr:MAG: hypothetical protein J3K34DRAFT_417461 [Monoraphidium minutum]
MESGAAAAREIGPRGKGRAPRFGAAAAAAGQWAAGSRRGTPRLPLNRATRGSAPGTKGPARGGSGRGAGALSPGPAPAPRGPPPSALYTMRPMPHATPTLPLSLARRRPPRAWGAALGPGRRRPAPPGPTWPDARGSSPGGSASAAGGGGGQQNLRDARGRRPFCLPAPGVVSAPRRACVGVHARRRQQAKARRCFARALIRSKGGSKDCRPRDSSLAGPRA